ncbi:MAG: YIP1 family protein [Solirubrobacterales bacterium]
MENNQTVETEFQSQHPDGPNSSPLKWLVQVLYSPSEVFHWIKDNPKWLSAALVQILFGAALAVVVIFLNKSVILDQLAKTMSAEKVPTVFVGTLIAAGVTALLTPFILWLLQSLLLLVYNQLGLGEARFGQLMAVSVISSAPGLLGGLLKSPFYFWLGIEKAQKITTSPALLLPQPDPKSFLYAFLGQLDFFVLWGMVLLALGGAIVMRKEEKFSSVLIYCLAAFVALAAIVGLITSKLAQLQPA